MAAKSIYKYVLSLGILISLALSGVWYIKYEDSRLISPETTVTEKTEGNIKEKDAQRYINKSKDQIFAEMQSSYTINDYRASMEKQIAVIKTLLDNVDLIERIALDRELTFLKIKLDNVSQSYDEKIHTLVEVVNYLNVLKLEFSSKEFNSALTTLVKGETKIANLLLSKIENKNRVTLGGTGFDRAANAVYLQGKIAESQIDYRRAFHYFRQAVKYDPENVTYLLAAGRLADDLALYGNAIMYYEAALYNSNENVVKSPNQTKKLLLKLGKIWESKGDKKRASEYFQQAKN